MMRDSCLETLNDFASWMEAATKEAHSALTQAADDMAQFYMPITKKPHYTRSETRSGLMDRISQQHI